MGQRAEQERDARLDAISLVDAKLDDDPQAYAAVVDASDEIERLWDLVDALVVLHAGILRNLKRDDVREAHQELRRRCLANDDGKF